MCAETSTLQNDSAYDSNDPDADSSSAISSPGGLPPVPVETPAGVEPGGPPCAWNLGREPIISTVARLKSSLCEPERRYSEPSMSASQQCPESRKTNQKLTRSEDDFTRAQPASHFESEEAEDPFPEEVFPALEGKTRRPRDLKVQNSTQGLASLWGPVPKACSSGSLDTSSDSSPMASPSSPKRNFFTRHQSFTKTDKSKSNREIKKHSMSFSFASHKALTKTPSVMSVKSKAFARDQVRKGMKKESQLAGRIVQEHLPETHGRGALDLSSRSCATWAEDVFRLVDQRRPGSPPSYQEAMRCQELAAHRSQTVGGMRARMLSLDTGLPPRLPCHHGGDPNVCGQEPRDGHRLAPRTESWKQSRTVCAPVETIRQATVTGRPELHRLRTVSESKQRSKWDYPVRRCSQPVFEADQLQYAKESYI